MAEKLIPATQLAEYVYCSQAWYLKLHGTQVSVETRGIQAQADAWHEEQGRSLAKGDSYRWATYAAALLAVVLFLFCWLGWSR
jgi:hypothetical protein